MKNLKLQFKNIKKPVFVFLFMLANTTIYCQEFKMKLWLIDGIGNKDSVEIGYDQLASDEIDTAFGEVNIFSTPWSTNFEVRAGDASTSLTNQYFTSPTIIHTKKQYINKTCDFFHLIKIAVNCKNFPLVIKWDTSVFLNNTCGYSSFITSGTFWGGDWFDGAMAFMNPQHDWYNKDSLVISELGGTSSPVTYSQNNQEIMQLNVSFGQTMPNTSVNDNIFENIFTIFPNPTKNSLFIKTNNMKIGVLNIKLYDIVGKLVFNKIFDDNLFDIIEINDLSLRNGIYHIVISDNKNIYKKIIIISK